MAHQTSPLEYNYHTVFHLGKTLIAQGKKGNGTRYLNDTKTVGLGATTNNGFTHTWKSSLYKLKCGMCNIEHDSSL